jgi:hypothetical protein
MSRESSREFKASAERNKQRIKSSKDALKT